MLRKRTIGVVYSSILCMMFDIASSSTSPFAIAAILPNDRLGPGAQRRTN